MGYEIDFLPVEAGEKSGDAIAFRIFDNQYYWIFVIDGGYTDSGDALVQHINDYYHTNIVNAAILTHPDGDHANGMLRVVERMDVKNVWMHQPWNHGNLGRLFRHDRVTDASVAATLRRDLDAAKAVEKEALRRHIPITEPFTGAKFGEMVYVLGPTLDFYQAQIAHFNCTPAAAAPPPRIALRIAGTPPREDWTNETLDHTCDTSAENNTSVILAVRFADDYWGMFTGDAGDTALVSALDHMNPLFSTSNFKFVQIPHHGSEHNISPAILNRWLGPPQLVDQRTRTAFVSSAAAAPKHPSDKVMNAFRRRGAWPYATEGRKIWQHSADAPARPDYTSIAPYPFFQGAA